MVREGQSGFGKHLCNPPSLPALKKLRSAYFHAIIQRHPVLTTIFSAERREFAYAPAPVDGSVYSFSLALSLAGTGCFPGNHPLSRLPPVAHADPDELSRSLSSQPSLHAVSEETCAHVRVSQCFGGRGRGEEW